MRIKIELDDVYCLDFYPEERKDDAKKKLIARHEGVEKVYREKPPAADQDITKKIIKGFKTGSEAAIDVTGINLKNFIRSYRAAFLQLVPVDFKNPSYTKTFQAKVKKEVIYVIDGVEFSCKYAPGYAHIGNIFFRCLGDYGKERKGKGKIPILSKIDEVTANNPEYEKKLALLFLEFCSSAHLLTKDQLTKVNPNFNAKGRKLKDKLRVLTAIAFLFAFLEPVRRMVPGYDAEDEILPELAVTSSQIMCLKLMSKGLLRASQIFDKGDCNFSAVTGSYTKEYKKSAKSSKKKEELEFVLTMPVRLPFSQLMKTLEADPVKYKDIFDYWDKNKDDEFKLTSGTLVPKRVHIKKMSLGLDDETTTAGYDEDTISSASEDTARVLKITSDEVQKSSLKNPYALYGTEKVEDKDEEGIQKEVNKDNNIWNWCAIL